MNSVLQTIRARRSMRDYRKTPISQTVLEEIITAALYAPSGLNRQPWHLTVITNPKIIDQVTAEMKAAVQRDKENPDAEYVSSDEYHVTYGAPVLVIVSIDMTLATTGVEDGALLLGTMFLAAQSFGVGSCWINQVGSLNDEAAFRAFLAELGVPSGNTITGAAALGYATSETPPAPPRKSGTVTYVK